MLCDGYVFDFIPIGSVLLFHYRNFRVQNSDPETVKETNNHIQTPRLDREEVTPMYQKQTDESDKNTHEISFISNEDYIRKSIKQMHDNTFRERQSTRKSQLGTIT